jgi:hypothetical protein
MKVRISQLLFCQNVEEPVTVHLLNMFHITNKQFHYFSVTCFKKNVRENGYFT